MPGPGGREVGRVSIRVLPNTSQFGKSLGAYIQRIERSLRIELPVDLEQPSLRKAEAELAALARDRKSTIEVDVDGAALAALQTSVAGLGGSGGGLGRGMGGLISTLVIASAVIGLIPVLTTALAGIPAAIGLFAAPLGAILLGADGLNAAAARLSESFTALKDSLAVVFERVFTPIFDQMTSLFPTLRQGLGSIAVALGETFQPIVDTLTSPEGLASLSAIFSTIAAILVGLAPVAGQFTDTFLLLAETGLVVFASLTPVIQATSDKFADLFARLEADGSLSKAFMMLGLIVLGLLQLMATLFDAGIRMQAFTYNAGMFFIQMGQNVARGMDVLGQKVSSVWASVKAAFQGGVGTAVAVVSGLPDRVLGAVGNMGSLLMNAGRQVIEGFIDGIQSGFARVRSTLGNLTSLLPDWKGPASLDKVILRDSGRLVMGGFLEGLESRYRDVQRSLGGLTADLAPAVAGAGVGGTGLSLTQNIYPQQGQSEYEIGRISADQMTLAARR